MHNKQNYELDDLPSQATNEAMMYLPEKYSLEDLIKEDNIAMLLSEEVLKKIGSEVVAGYVKDYDSRRPWLTRYEKAMGLAMQVYEERTYPWRGASNIKFPLMTLACLQFHARAYPALIPSKGVVSVKTTGKDPFGFKRRRAERVALHMNYQFHDQMEEWEEDMDRLLITLPITGTEFKKTYYSPTLERPVSKHVFAKDLVVDYYATSLEKAARVTEVLSMSLNDLEENARAGIFMECQFPEDDSSAARQDIPTRVSDKVQMKQVPTTAEGPREVLEQHTWYDLDGDGYKEPYICTVDRRSEKVLRIVARFNKKGIERRRGMIVKVTPEHYYTKFEFVPSPDGGFYGIGFGTIIYPINESVNSIINQLVDAGTLSNLQSGFVTKSFKQRGGSFQFEPGEWKTVNATMQDLRQGIFPLPVREPSMVLFNLLSLLIDIGQRVTSTTDMMVGENPGQNQKATTTMAVVENGMRVFTAVYKRLRRSLTKETKLVYQLNKNYLDDVAYFTVVDPTTEELEEMKVKGSDYEDDSMDIIPTADPNAVSQFHKMARAEALMNTIQFGAPVRNVLMRFYDALEIENPEELLPPPPEQQQPPLEAQLAIAEEQREQMKQQLDSQIKLREQDRKEFETQIKAVEAQTTAQLKNKEIDTRAEVESMSAVLSHESERRKQDNDREAADKKAKSGDQ